MSENTQQARAWNVAVRSSADDALEIAVYDQIGSGFFSEGIEAQDVLDQLRAKPNAKKITLRVNSAGGILDEAKAMVNLLRDRAANGVEIDGVVDGLAASAAAYLLTAAGKVTMPANAFLMVHEVRGGMWGTADELQTAADMFRKTNDQLAEAYAAASARRGKSKSKGDYLSAFAAGDLYLTADEAIDWGLADEKLPELGATNAASLAHIGDMPSAPQALLSAPYVVRNQAPAAPAVNGAVPYDGYKPIDDKSWDGEAAVERMRKWASSNNSGDAETIDWAKYSRGFTWFDSAHREAFGSYKLPHHDVQGGELVTMRAGVIAAGNAVNGSRGGVQIPDSDIDAVKNHLAKHYRQFDLTAPWERDTSNRAPSAQESNTMSSDNFTQAIIRALGLPPGATEADCISAATNARECQTQVVTLTGVTNTGEAIGAVRALTQAGKENAQLRTENDKLRSERDAQNFETQLQRGTNEGKLSPAECNHYRERFERALNEGRGAEVVDDLKGFINVATVKRAPAVQQPPANKASSGAATEWNGKTYQNMKPLERSRLANADPELWQLMKNEWEAAGCPAPQTTAA